jgi:hypothetical protein
MKSRANPGSPVSETHLRDDLRQARSQQHCHLRIDHEIVPGTLASTYSNCTVIRLQSSFCCWPPPVLRITGPHTRWRQCIVSANKPCHRPSRVRTSAVSYYLLTQTCRTSTRPASQTRITSAEVQIDQPLYLSQRGARRLLT